MAARGYEISLRVLKNILREREANERNIFQQERRNFVPNHITLIYNFDMQLQQRDLFGASSSRKFRQEQKKRNQEGSEGGRDGNLLLPLRSSISFALALTFAPQRVQAPYKTTSTTAKGTSKNKRFNEQNNNSARASRFFVPFFAFTAQLRREMTKF